MTLFTWMYVLVVAVKGVVAVVSNTDVLPAPTYILVYVPCIQASICVVTSSSFI